MNYFKTLFKNFRREIFSFEGSPSYIAKGFALGSFIGMLPIPGFHIISTLFFATFLKLNKKSAFLGVIKTNVFTIGFIFAFNFYLGKQITGIETNFIFPKSISFNFLKTLFQSGADVFFVLLVGGIISGIFSALINYFLLIHWIKNYRNYVFY